MTDKIYAGGRVAVLSTKLLTEDKFMRLADCRTLADALRVLGEIGFGGDVAAEEGDYEALLNAEVKSAVDLFRELSSDAFCERYFLCRYDYLNAKVLAKCKYMRTDGVPYCFDCAAVEPEKAQNAIKADEYDLFSPFMRRALEQIDERFAFGARSPRTIDLLLDKAMYEEMRYAAKKSKFSVLKTYYKFEADAVNLMTLFRAEKARLPKEDFAEMLVEGGDLDAASLLAVYGGDKEKFAEGLDGARKQYFRLLTEGAKKGDLSRAERFAAEEKRRMLTENPDALSIAPLVAYYTQKTEEADKIRFALIGIKNNVDREIIKDRLRNG